VEQREKRQVLTGGVVLVTLGVLIALNNYTEFKFTNSWPILLIVIAITTLVQSPKDFVGWFVGVVGLVFLIDSNWSIQVGYLRNYILPPLLILIGLFMIARKSKK
jgi:hypothetical protein